MAYRFFCASSEWIMSTEHITTNGYQLDSPEQPKAADWYALRLLSNYRLFLLVCITALFYLYPHQSVLGQISPKLFHATLISYLVAGVIFNHLIRVEKPDHDTQFYIQAYVDIICITLLMHASGGIQSGFGILLVANIAIIGIFTTPRYTFLFAAIATTAVLAQELYTGLTFNYDSTSFVKTGFTGMALFAVAYVTSVVLQKRFPYRSTSEKLIDNFNQIEELNRHIIQQMESGIIVVDKQWRVQLLNDSAISMLDLDPDSSNEKLLDICPQLHNALGNWEKSPFSGTKAFKSKSHDSELLPYFRRIGKNATLISLEDYRLVAEQVQQLKLASLGGLTASIAHEIRNPLAAINSSVQLLAENKTLDATDRRMLDIAERNCGRVNKIIEDILQLSRREKIHRETINLQSYLQDFILTLTEQGQISSNQIDLEISKDMEISFDPLHLEQILNNLCLNAQFHNPEKEDLQLIITCEIGAKNNDANIIVSDNGKGIHKNIIDEVFEPFYTTSHNGTGLGLFIIRELCEINNARISYLSQSIGAGFRIQTALTNRQG